MKKYLLAIVYFFLNFNKAEEALDNLFEPNPYLRKDKHYLSPLEPKCVEKIEGMFLIANYLNYLKSFLFRRVFTEINCNFIFVYKFLKCNYRFIAHSNSRD